MGFLKRLFGGSDEKEPASSVQHGPVAPPPPQDWRQSTPHIAFLGLFLNPREPSYASDYEDWHQALREPPRRVVDRWIYEGALVPPPLPEVLDYHFKAPDLKALLKERDLKVTGKKSELIQRLLDADPETMQKRVQKIHLVWCSDWARQIAQQYIDYMAAQRTMAEDKSWQALWNRNYQQAAIINANFDSMQVLRTAISAHHVEAHLRYLDHIPFKAYLALPPDQQQWMRTFAGMEVLWGPTIAKRHLPKELIIDSPYAPSVLSNLIRASIDHQRSMAQYKQWPDIKKFTILSCEDSCAHCKQAAERSYTFKQVPSLPHDACTTPRGCRCTVRPYG